MTEIDIQLATQLGLAVLAGVILGAIIGGLLRLRRTGQLQQALADTSNQLQQLEEELAAVCEQREVLRESSQSAEIRVGRLETQLSERARQHAEQVALLNENREALKGEFENLANKIFEDKGRSFTTTSKESLESLLKPFREQISGFQKRVNEVHSESIKGNTNLESEIRKVL